MWEAIAGWLKTLFGGKGTTQIGKENQAVSGSSTGDNSPVVTAGRDLFFNMPPPTDPHKPQGAFTEETEATIRNQIGSLTRPEVVALKQIVMCGQMTEEQLSVFCQQEGLEMVNPGILARKVTFLTRDFALGAWSVLPGLEPAVRKVLSEDKS